MGEGHFGNAHRHEPDIIRVRHRVHRAAAFKSDVELARQIVEVAVIQNVMMQRVGKRANVQKFLRINSRRR